MKTTKIFRYTVDVWLPMMTVIAECYYIEEGRDDLLANVRKDFGKDAKINIVECKHVLTNKN